MIEGDNQQKLLLNRPRTGVAASVSSYTWCGLPSSSSLSQTTPALVCGLQQLAYTLAAQQAQERGPQLLRGLYTLAAQQAQERGPTASVTSCTRCGLPWSSQSTPALVCGLQQPAQHARLLNRPKEENHSFCHIVHLIRVAPVVADDSCPCLWTAAADSTRSAAHQASGGGLQLFSARALCAGCSDRRRRLLCP